MRLDLLKSLNSILRYDRTGENPLPDPLRFSYFKINEKQLLEELQRAIDEAKIQVKPLLQIDVPKENFSIRPMARPEIQDWILYQSLVDYLIPKIIPKLSKKAISIQNYSRKPIQSWMKFEKLARQFYKKGYKYTVVTDISGYFENINLDELRNKLINYVSSNDLESKVIIDLLYTNFLIPWSTGRVKNFGIPQGPSASSFLGDVYLDIFDKDIQDEFGYIRYMDDIRVFCKSKIQAKKALIKIIQSLRKYKLNINSKKTKILEEKEIENHLFDPKKEVLDSIEDAFKSQDRAKIQAIAPILLDVFQKSFKDSDLFSKRHIKFSLFRLSILKNSGFDLDFASAVNLILKYFFDKPQHADDFCSFLTLFSKEKKIISFLLQFLSSDEKIYEWQEIHVLRALLEINVNFNKSHIKKFIKIYKNRNNHWAKRSLYALIVGKYGSNLDRELLIDGLNDYEVDELKNNVIIAVQNLGLAARANFYQKLSNNVWTTSLIK